MQTTTRPRENGASFAPRRGHLPQLSISDDNHHVTEAIGYMYEDESDSDPRQTSGGRQENNNQYHEQNAVHPMHTEGDHFPPRRTSVPRKRLPERQMSNGGVILGPGAQMRPSVGRGGSWEQQQKRSPSPSLGAHERSGSDTATSSFPLNDIDYESSPAAVAQELSNLQALRRMSMNVDLGAAGDPDLPQLAAAAMPSSPSQEEDDPSRLFWVPARLHPELAPKEFKTFLDSKAEQIKRRSGELSQFTSPTSSRSSSLSVSDTSGGLRRKKSMLSRQIHSPVGYEDGADRLERKKSAGKNSSPDPNLQELESLVSETNRNSVDSSTTEENGDIILPSVPGSSLKRSTRTNYRRGGSVKGRGDRNTYAQRAARRAAGGGDTPTASATADTPPLPSFSTEVSNLAQTLSFSPLTSESPLVANKREAHNFSRPALTRVPSPPSQPPLIHQSTPKTFDGILGQIDQSRLSTASAPERKPESMGLAQQRPESLFDKRAAVPQIVEVPPTEDHTLQGVSTPPSAAPSSQPPVRHPERSSSRETKIAPVQRPSMPPKQSSSMAVPSSRIGAVSPPGSFRASQQPQSLEQPSPLPGNNTNSNDLTFIPTLTVDKRADHKKKEEKKSSWSWLLGKEDDKEKAEKPKAKVTKSPQSDNTRLDVLQTSINGQKSRESLVLDRESLKLEEERKKESARKSSGHEGKKEKDGFLSSIFGGKKGKDKEAQKKMHRLSPEPTYRELKPDIDYNWTRFSILEERAIYRMAHIKLANPRRALYSQVLLSNFMYSYLAKVQQMHPQMNLPTSAKQQRKQQQPTTKEQQPDEFQQYQRYQQQQAQQNAQQQQALQESSQQTHQQQQYNPQQSHESDSAPPVHDHDRSSHQRPTSRGSKHSTDSDGSAYPNGHQHYHHQQQRQANSRNDDDDEDMW